MRLRNIARPVGGTGFPHQYQGRDEGDFPFYKVRDFGTKGNERYVRSAANWVQADVARELGATPVPPESILLPKVGAALLGNARRITTQDSIFDNNVLGLITNYGDIRYLHYQIPPSASTNQIALWGSPNGEG